MKDRKMKILENNTKKIVMSKDYNYIFNKNNGIFIRWGKDKEDDPLYAPSNEILDLEVTTSCKYVCKFCYKSNNPNGINMSFEDFKTIFDKVSKNHLLTQIAFGVDAYCKSNPDIWKMMEYSRQHGVIPNVTVAELDDETADNIVKYCGACAVSQYANKDICYNSVKKLTDRGMTQVNIHKMICNEFYEQSLKLIDDVKNDLRLEKLNAVVFLSLKQKGRGIGFHPLDNEKFLKLIKKSFENKIGFGFDSCTAPKFLKAAQVLGFYDKVKDFSEPCESSLFSAYINVKGEFYPCSFSENTEGWETGLDVLHCNDFVKDIWNNERTIQFRNKLLKNTDCNHCRMCPIYKI